MSKEFITVHEALIRKKILKKRIESCEFDPTIQNSISNSLFAVIKDSDRKNKDNIKSGIQSLYNKTISVYNNYNVLSMAIMFHNSVTHITVAGKDYTIAQAIAYKNSLSESKEMYSSILTAINSCKSKVEYLNAKALEQDKVDNYISSKISQSFTPDTIITLTKEFTELYKREYLSEFFDPCGLEKECTKKLEEMEKFEVEIDSVLIKSNISSILEIEFVD